MRKITKFIQLQIFIISLFFAISSYGQVGIGNTDPATTLDIEGSISLRDGGQITLTNNNNNDVALPLVGGQTYSTYRITGPTGTFNIGSIVPVTNSDGQIVVLQNTTTHNMTIRHNAGGLAPNRIFVPGGQNVVLRGQYSTASLMYSTAQSRWILVSHDDNRYGDNIQSAVGTTDISINTATFTDMTDMTITFTPKHSTVYVSFSASGHSSLAGIQMYADFRLVNVTAGNTVIAGTTTVATDFDFDDLAGIITINSWNAQLVTYPVTVTPGTSTTLKIQWRRDGNFPDAVFNSAGSLIDWSHRNMTILD